MIAQAAPRVVLAEPSTPLQLGDDPVDEILEVARGLRVAPRGMAVRDGAGGLEPGRWNDRDIVRFPAQAWRRVLGTSKDDGKPAFELPCDPLDEYGACG